MGGSRGSSFRLPGGQLRKLEQDQEVEKQQEQEKKEEGELTAGTGPLPAGKELVDGVGRRLKAERNEAKC